MPQKLKRDKITKGVILTVLNTALCADTVKPTCFVFCCYTAARYTRPKNVFVYTIMIRQHSHSEDA